LGILCVWWSIYNSPCSSYLGNEVHPISPYMSSFK
jgi:hypothetical protein